MKVMSINSKELLMSSSTIAAGETNDCVVFAFASAFGTDYDTAHAEVKQRFKREDKKGTGSGRLIEGLQVGATFNGKTVTEVVKNPTTNYKAYGQVVPRSIRLSSFAANKPKGTYFVLVRGHAIAIKDGVIVDNNKAKPSSIIQYVFKIEDLH